MPHPNDGTISSPVLAEFFQELSPKLPEEITVRVAQAKQRAYQADPQLDSRRRWLIADWLLRVFTPAWLDAFSKELADLSQATGAVAKIVNDKTKAPLLIAKAEHFAAVSQAAAAKAVTFQELPPIETTASLEEACLLINDLASPFLPVLRKVSRPRAHDTRIISQNVRYAMVLSGGQAAFSMLMSDAIEQDPAVIGSVLDTLLAVDAVVKLTASVVPRSPDPHDTDRHIRGRLVTPALAILPLTIDLLERLIDLE